MAMRWWVALDCVNAEPVESIQVSDLHPKVRPPVSTALVELEEDLHAVRGTVAREADPVARGSHGAGTPELRLASLLELRVAAVERPVLGVLALCGEIRVKRRASPCLGPLLQRRLMDTTGQRDSDQVCLQANS
jgi:hypothetical protein|eukprot:COSAG06_NODE_62_length_27058_cov_17.867725_4_plen_134_part_00